MITVISLRSVLLHGTKLETYEPRAPHSSRSDAWVSYRQQETQEKKFLLLNSLLIWWITNNFSDDNFPRVEIFLKDNLPGWQYSDG